MASPARSKIGAVAARSLMTSKKKGGRHRWIGEFRANFGLEIYGEKISYMTLLENLIANLTIKTSLLL
jgi:hypothetical protein